MNFQGFTLYKRQPTTTQQGDLALYWDEVAGQLKDATGKVYDPFHRIVYPLLAASVDTFIWTCQEGVWRVRSVVEAHTVVGGSGATVTVTVCPGSVAIASGTAQLSAALDLTVTAPAKAFGTLIASPTEMSRGDSLAIDMSGTLTGLVGVLTVMLERVK